MYVIKGHLRMFAGPDWKMQTYDVGPGDFFYGPRGEIHGLQNLSTTESAEMIAMGNSAGRLEDSGIVFVEPPWE